MDPQLLSPNREPAIWARLMQTSGDELSPEAATYLLSIRFGETTLPAWGNWLNARKQVS